MVSVEAPLMDWDYAMLYSKPSNHSVVILGEKITQARMKYLRWTPTWVIVKNNVWKMLWSWQMKKLWDEIGLSQKYRFSSSTTVYLDNAPVSLTFTILKAFNTDYCPVIKSFSCEESEKVDYMYITAENGSEE